MTKIFGIVGWSGSGKTDLTTRIIEFLVKKNIIVASIKHTHHDFEIDKEGKDSHKHIQSGANEVMIYSKKKWALISKVQKNSIKIEELIKKFEKKTELIIVEGLKYSSFPKVEVIRSCLNKPFIYEDDQNIKAIVIDKKISKLESLKLPLFNFSETEEIANFILNSIEK